MSRTELVICHAILILLILVAELEMLIYTIENMTFDLAGVEKILLFVLFSLIILVLYDVASDLLNTCHNCENR